MAFLASLDAARDQLQVQYFVLSGYVNMVIVAASMASCSAIHASAVVKSPPRGSTSCAQFCSALRIAVVGITIAASASTPCKRIHWGFGMGVARSVNVLPLQASCCSMGGRDKSWFGTHCWCARAPVATASPQAGAACATYPAILAWLHRPTALQICEKGAQCNAAPAIL